MKYRFLTLNPSRVIRRALIRLRARLNALRRYAASLTGALNHSVSGFRGSVPRISRRTIVRAVLACAFGLVMGCHSSKHTVTDTASTAADLSTVDVRAARSIVVGADCELVIDSPVVVRVDTASRAVARARRVTVRARVARVDNYSADSSRRDSVVRQQTARSTTDAERRPDARTPLRWLWLAAVVAFLVWLIRR